MAFETADAPEYALSSAPAIPIPRPDPLYHIVLLTMCTGMLVLAPLLAIREETQVLIPLLGTPLPELCMFKRTMGVSCPGCGMTRCFISLAHGNLAAAWHYNPAGPLLFAMVAVQVPFRLIQLYRIRRGWNELQVGWLTPALMAVLGVMMVGQWLLRLVGVSW